MDHRSSNSPDPPGGRHHLVADQDSQESVTLQNALQPLPDTQPEASDLRISPKNSNSVVTPWLIARPQPASVDDFSDGFAFGKPKEIKSGQYSRRGDNAKPIGPVMQASILGSAPQMPNGDSRDHVAATEGHPVARIQQALPRHFEPSHENGMQLRQSPQTASTTDVSASLTQEEGPQQDVQSRQVAETANLPVQSPQESGIPQCPRSPQAGQRTVAPRELDVPQGHNPLHIVEGKSFMQVPVPQDSHAASIPQGPCPMQSQLPRALQDPAQPALETRPRKKAPFNHYQPQYRAPKQQVPSPVTSFTGSHLSTTGPRPGHHSRAGQNVAVNQIHQLGQVSPPSAQVPQHKPRVSLRNDTSVSTAQPPTRMSTLSPNVALTSRLMKDGRRHPFRKNTPAEQPSSGRSITHSSIIRSNSKAKRCRSSRAPSSIQTTSTDARSQRDGQRTPTARGRSDSIPQEALKRQFATKFTAAAAHISASLNDNLEPLMDEVNQHLVTIYTLKQKLKQQRGKMTSYKEEVEDKSAEVHQLEGERGHLLAEVQAKNEELQKTSGRISKLEEKCRQYKEYLNSAIAEQQELYKATKAKCDGAVAQMKAEESKRKGFQDRELKRAEAVREELNQLVKSTVTEYQHQEREFHNKIEALNEKLEERDADIKREREQAQVLLQQNSSISSVEDSLKAFAAQMAELSSKVDAVVAVQHRQDDPALEETKIKLDQIMQTLCGLSERTPPSADIKKEMQEMNAQTMSSILEKLEPILAAQVETKASLEVLTAEIQRSVDDLCEELEDRQSVIEEYCHQRIERRDERISVLQKQVDEFEAELAHQNKLVYDTAQTLKQRMADVKKLELIIEDLTEDQGQNTVRSEQLEELRRECTKLKDASVAQDSKVTELQTKLQETITQLRTEEQNHREHADNLRQQLEQQVAEAKTAQEKAVETAQHQTMLRMNGVKAGLEEQISQVLEERTAQRLELQAAKKTIAQIESTASERSAKTAALEKELASSRAQASADSEQASLKYAEQQTAIEKQQKVIDDLQLQLDRTETKFRNLANNAIAYDRAAQTVVFGMRQWTKNIAGIHTTAKDLQKDGVKSGALDGVDVRFKPLVEMQLLLTAVHRYCQSQKEAARLLSRDFAAQTASETFPMVETAGGSVSARIPRVIIRSPGNSAASPKPPSVQIEQERRRIGEQPKSILKPTAYTQSRDEDISSELANNTWMNRAPYNRLVEGTSAKPSVSAGAVETRKRKQNFGQDSNQKRAKEATEGSSSAFFSPPGHDGRSGSRPVPQAPRKPGSSQSLIDGIVSPERLSSPSRASQSSQDEPRNGRLLSKPRRQTVKGVETDALTIFMRRQHEIRTEASQAAQNIQAQTKQGSQNSQNTGHSYPSQQRPRAEESQESHTHSQDFGGHELSPLRLGPSKPSLALE